MTIVVNTSATEWIDGKSYIGYDNAMLRDGASISASQATPSHPASDAAGWSAATQWRTDVGGNQTITLSLPAPEEIDSWGLYKSNLGDVTPSQVVAEYSTDGINWVAFGTPFAPVGESPTIFEIVEPAVIAQFWRLRITGAQDPIFLANLFFGKALRLFGSPELGWSPPKLARANDFINSRSEGGDFLGRSLIRRGSKTNFSLSVVQRAWVYDNWLPFMKAAELHPFYFAWDAVTLPSDAAFCYTDGPIPKPQFNAPQHLNLGLSFIAL